MILERLNECCFDCIDNGNRDKAKQDLELINLVQERMGGETFEDLEAFLLDDSDHINYHHIFYQIYHNFHVLYNT